MRKAITPGEIELLGRLVKEKSGIFLDQSKAYLFESRLSHLLEEFDVHTYKDLHGLILQDRSGAVCARVVEALCTHETSFFRDKSPFSLLAGRLAPEFFRHCADKTLHILSAACATGQEVYSAAMILADAGFAPPTHQVRFVAADISDAAIAAASLGVYTKFELARGLDSVRLHKYFNREGENAWRIKDEIRSMVFFKKANLLDPQAVAALGKFNIVLCRNVAIYFSLEDKRRLFACLETVLNPKGNLIVGATESLLGVTDRFARFEDRETVYYGLFA